MDHDDIRDSKRDEERLKQDTASIDLPDVKDIPGQEHIHVPPAGEMADITISSDDEEGTSIFEEDEEDEIIVMTEEEDSILVSGFPDNADADGDPLNERVNVSGSDLDTGGLDEDDRNENIGEEDEENNNYSLGGDREQD